jgi:hypothetical protein
MANDKPLDLVDHAYNRGRADFILSLRDQRFDLFNPYHSMDQPDEYDAWDRAVMDALSES